jgi:hypothetical protein
MWGKCELNLDKDGGILRSYGELGKLVRKLRFVMVLLNHRFIGEVMTKYSFPVPRSSISLLLMKPVLTRGIVDYTVEVHDSTFGCLKTSHTFDD